MINQLHRLIILRVIFVVQVDFSVNHNLMQTNKVQQKRLKILIKNPNTTGLVKKTVYDTKTTEIENKIPSITNSVKKLIMTRSQKN